MKQKAELYDQLRKELATLTLGEAEVLYQDLLAQLSIDHLHILVAAANAELALRVRRVIGQV